MGGSAPIDPKDRKAWRKRTKALFRKYGLDKDKLHDTMSEIHEKKRSGNNDNPSDYNNSSPNSQANYEDPDETDQNAGDENADAAAPAQQHFAANPVAPQAPKEEIKAPPGPG